MQTKKRIYLINPANPDNFWAMNSTIKAVGVKGMMPNAALATLVSLTPQDLSIEYIYCDENLNQINYDMDCDLVAITGYTLHSKSIKRIAQGFSRRDKKVAIGGVYATLYPEVVEPFADYLFVGEAEHTWPRFLRQWITGSAAPIYRQLEFIDMTQSPPPNWSAVNGSDYLYFTVQTSRGCPNNCDFCDAIRVVGRKYRTKKIPQIIEEVANAYSAGAETIFFSEDNFFVNKKFTIELLKQLIKWNTSVKYPVSFAAQATIKLGEDEEVLKLLADARFSVVFLGLESLRKECLQEVNKGRMAVHDPVKCITNISKYGIIPFVGLIVGFDNDDENTFGELEDFLTKTASPIASVSVLNAPENTRLYDRMKEAGRLNEDFLGVWHFTTNIKPVAMPIETLIAGHQNLFRSLFEPEAFKARMLDWLDNVEYRTTLYKGRRTRPTKYLKLLHIMKYYFLHEPRPVRNMFFGVLASLVKENPKHINKAITLLSQYCHYYDFANR